MVVGTRRRRPEVTQEQKRAGSTPIARNPPTARRSGFDPGAWRLNFELDTLAVDLGGVLHGVAGRPEIEVEGLSIDSRTVGERQLFAALVEQRDGHEFVPAARTAGAAAVLVQRVVDDGPSLVVPDVALGLQELARVARRRLHGPVVGVTGSVGKTTTKDMLANVLGARMRTAASERSFNNELGVPLTLANAPADTEATVVEMGARGSGHIALLCTMASPTVGVVTAVHAVHTELMGSEDDIARAKAELVESLPPEGLAVLNGADPRVAAMSTLSSAEVLTFGGDAGDVTATGVVIDDDLRPGFTLHSPWGDAEVHLGARGEHNVDNALAAASVALWLGIEPEAVAMALEMPPASPWRMQLERSDAGITVLNDAYNAGPASMAAALRSLAALPAGHRVAVLGLMAELGDRSEAEHLAVAKLAEELEIDLLAVGTDQYGSAHTSDAADGSDSVLEVLRERGWLAPDTAVLVKGSRVAGLESVAEQILSFGAS